MSYFVFTRILSTLPVMLVVSFIVFSILYFAPGDPAIVLVGDHGNQADVAAMREQLGLNDPFFVQLFRFIGGIVQGDLGNSLFFGKQPVTSLVAQRLEPTIALTISTIVVCVLVAVPLGTLAAWRAGKPIDRVIMTFSVLGFSVPTFVLGYTLVFVFSMSAGLTPVQGYTSISEGFLPFVRSIILPTATLGLVFLVLLLRITRASVLETLNEDYVRTARAKGVSESLVLFRHALRNAAVPIATVIGLGITMLISGVVITETVFNIPGLGRLIVDAIEKRDYPVIQGIIIIVSFLYVIINSAIDILYAFLDPRIRY